MIRILFPALALFISAGTAFTQTLADRLAALSTGEEFTYSALPADTFFTEKYILKIRQPIDHQDTGKGWFEQRVFLAHRGFDKPVVFITEGYAAEYAGHPRYIHELSSMLDASQVCAEHRYYGESAPDSMDWSCLNVANAAADHHHIAEILKQVYPGNWVSTGISKGGQTAMYYRTFYPDDVTATVGYVCPLNFSVEDKRVYRFMKTVGDAETRTKVIRYQQEMLQDKPRYLPEFERLTGSMNLHFAMGLEKGYELTVLEYSFAFWQWGNFSGDDIPQPEDGPEKMVQHLHRVADVHWVSDEGIRSNQPFFYQALTEIGFYGYDIAAFEPWVSFKSNPTFEFTAPENTPVMYDPGPMTEVDKFIRHEASNMIFLYGETDPWSSTAVDLTYNNNLIKVIKPGGSHLTRIRNLPEEQRKMVVETLRKWLNSSE